MECMAIVWLISAYDQGQFPAIRSPYFRLRHSHGGIGFGSIYGRRSAPSLVSLLQFQIERVAFPTESLVETRFREPFSGPSSSLLRLQPAYPTCSVDEGRWPCLLGEWNR